jgi:hypothetical protein
MQNYSSIKVFSDGTVLHYVEEVSGDFIKSNGGRIEGKLKGLSFALNVGQAWMNILVRSRLICRLLRLNRINVKKITDTRLLIIYDYKVFIYEIDSDYLKTIFRFERTRYVFTQSISVHGSQIVIGEYGMVGDSKAVGVLLSEDSGLSWVYRPLFLRGKTKNILAVKHDPYSGCYWVFTGDSQEESAIYIFDQRFDLIRTLGHGLDYRAVSSFFLADQVVWLTNNPFGRSRVQIYSRTTRTIEAGPILPGSVWCSTRIGKDIYCCTAAEDALGESGENVYMLHSQDCIHWGVQYTFKKDGLNKRLFLYGLGIFPEIGATPSCVYMNMDAVKHFDGCVVKISREPMPRSLIDKK